MGPLPDKGNCFLQKNLATSSRQNKCLKSLNSKTRLWENLVLSSLREKLMVFSKTHGTLWEILMVLCEWYLMFLWKRYPTVFFERFSLGPTTYAKNHLCPLREKSSWSLLEKSSCSSVRKDLQVFEEEDFLFFYKTGIMLFYRTIFCSFKENDFRSLIGKESSKSCVREKHGFLWEKN